LVSARRRLIDQASASNKANFIEARAVLDMVLYS
jgi:hypothetical protein